MTTKTELENLFLRRKPIRLLMSMKNARGDKYVSNLAKETDCTYSHTVKLLSVLKRLNIVDFKKEGRVKYVELTPSGRELAESVENVLRKLSKS